MWKKLKGWMCGWKFWVTLLAIIIGTMLFGSFVSSFGAGLFDIFSTIAGWIATALRWFAKIINFFGWNGMI